MASEKVTRRLAAIVAADMVGYSRLMQLDEAGIVVRQKACLDELIIPKIKEYGGRLVKTTGDGVLIEFPSAVDAVLCSVAVQREMTEREADIPEDHRIIYRVGINLGEIIIEGDDIFGDGVNIAARLEALAEPGGIRISRAVFSNVKGKLDLGFSDLGPQKVKNIAEPIPTYQVLLDPDDIGKFIEAKSAPTIGRQVVAAVMSLMIVMIAGYFAWDHFYSNETDTIAEPRLLVLPFEGETIDAELYAKGATDNFIASFAQLKGMTVVSRSTAIQYLGMKPALGELADKLGFQYALDGKIVLEDGNLAVLARLRNSSDEVVWQKTVKGSIDQAFNIIAKLKAKTTATMNVTLNSKERELLVDVPTTSMAAYLLYEEARRFQRSGDWTQHKQALALYEQAIGLDPDYLHAKTGSAQANFTTWLRSWNLVRITSEAHQAAQKTTQSILNSSPEYPPALRLKLLLKLEILNRDDALAEARSAVFRQPNEPDLRWALARALHASGFAEEAKDEFDNYFTLSPRLHPEQLRRLAEQYLRLGDAEKALSFLASIPKEQADNNAQNSLLIEAHAQLGNIEIAQEHLRRSKETFPFISLAWYKPFFETYADKEVFRKFAEAMTRVGVPEWPYGLEKKLEKHRLSREELNELYGNGSFKAIDAIGPFGQPFQQTNNKNGTLSWQFKWLPGIELNGRWKIIDNQVCNNMPASFMGRESCARFYWDREKSTETIKRYIRLDAIGRYKFAIERIDN